MGAAGIVAALAGRPRSRWYALAAGGRRDAGDRPARGRRRRLAAELRRRARDPALRTAPLAPGCSPEPRPAARRRALAEAAAMTIAATARDRAADVVSLRHRLAGLAAGEPARGARRGAGDVAGDAGRGRGPGRRGCRSSRSPGSPACSPPTSPRSPTWFAAPGWAQVELGARRRRRPARRLRGARRGAGPRRALAGPPCGVGLRAGARRAGLAGARRRLALARRCRSPASASRRRDPAAPAPGLRVRVLDVGQGDAILLAPGRRRAGARRRRAARRRRRRASSTSAGSTRLAALVITHPDLDHAGGAPEVLASARVDAPAARASRPGRCSARRAPRRGARCADRRRARAALRRPAAAVLWPPRPLAAEPGRDEPNAALAGPARPLARLPDAAHRRRRGRAGAGRTPGDVDVLKVAHHGSEDAGLGRLLDRGRARARA